MKSTFARFVCRILAASIFVLPFHARAEMIGTDPASFADRDGVVAQLQGFGLSHQEAMARVDRIDSLPAGSIGGLLPIIVIALLLWHFANTETPGAKPTTKPAPVPEK